MYTFIYFPLLVSSYDENNFYKKLQIVRVAPSSNKRFLFQMQLANEIILNIE